MGVIVSGYRVNCGSIGVGFTFGLALFQRRGGTIINFVVFTIVWGRGSVLAFTGRLRVVVIFVFEGLGVKPFGGVGNVYDRGKGPTT